MNTPDVVDFLEGRTAPDHRPVLAFDTNTIFGDRQDADQGIELIDTINQANALRDAEPEVGLVIPSVVLHEKVRQMGQRYGARFDVSLPLNFLRAKNLRVEDFTESHAVGVAARLQRLYPTRGDWRAFKRRRCLECLGLPIETATRDGHDCGAAVDWLIDGHAEAQGHLLITNDRGPEFQGVTRRTSLAGALAAAKQVLASRQSRRVSGS